MANQHFGKLADVWKHLPLAEIVALERPDHYCETHAGSASYDMVDDSERRFGVTRFLDVAEGYPALAASRYRQRLGDFEDHYGSLRAYPGSALMAMLERGSEASYLLCDLDSDSVASLERAVQRLGVTNARPVAADGMSSVYAYVRSVSGKILVHIDPFDPTTSGQSGLSALDLAGQLIRDGTGLMYWYGYDSPDERAWALDAISEHVEEPIRIWCGDVMITGPGRDRGGGNLGNATTPGTGFGIVCANISAEAIDTCEHLGHALERAYSRATLPNGDPGGIEFTIAQR